MFNLDLLFLMVGFAIEYNNFNSQPSLRSTKKLSELLLEEDLEPLH